MYYTSFELVKATAHSFQTILLTHALEKVTEISHETNVEIKCIKIY